MGRAAEKGKWLWYWLRPLQPWAFMDFYGNPPNPDQAMSDAANTLPLAAMPDVLDMVLEVYSRTPLPTL